MALGFFPGSTSGVPIKRCVQFPEIPSHWQVN